LYGSEFVAVVVLTSVYIMFAVVAILLVLSSIFSSGGGANGIRNLTSFALKTSVSGVKRLRTVRVAMRTVEKTKSRSSL
jgi:hypothetical protein